MIKAIEITKSEGKPLYSWYKGVFFNKEESTDNWLVATSKGTMTSRAVRKVAGDRSLVQGSTLGVRWCALEDAEGRSDGEVQHPTGLLGYPDESCGSACRSNSDRMTSRGSVR